MCSVVKAWGRKTKQGLGFTKVCDVARVNKVAYVHAYAYAYLAYMGDLNEQTTNSPWQERK